MTASRLAGPFAALTLALACGGKDANAPHELPARVIIAPSLDSIEQGDTVQFTATALDTAGKPVPATFTWYSSNPAVASVDSTGRVIALTPHLGAINASADGIVGNMLFHVVPAIATARIFPERARYVVGGTYQLLAVPRDSQGRHLTGRIVSWTVSDPTRLTLGSAGDSPQSIVAIPLAPGTVIVTAHLHRGTVVDTVQVGQVSFDSLWVGYGRVCANSTTGVPYCWGSGIANRLGSGMQVDAHAPQGVSGGYQFVSQALSDVVGCGVAAGGSTYCWGEDTVYAAGNYSGTVDSVPHQVAPQQLWSALYTGGLGGDGASLCGLSSGIAYCWGNNRSGQLGVGDGVDRQAPTAVLGGLTFRTLTMIRGATCGITTNDKLYCWPGAQWQDNGTPPPGICGPAIPDWGCPLPLQDTLSFTRLSGNNQVICAVDANGNAWCWDSRSFGPPAPAAPGYQFLDLSVSDSHSCGILFDHSAVCWGGNDYGELGDGTVLAKPVPVPVAGGHSFAVIRVDDSFSCGIDLSGTTWCWGVNAFGAIGDGTATNRLVPTRVLGQP